MTKLHLMSSNARLSTFTLVDVLTHFVQF